SLFHVFLLFCSHTPATSALYTLSLHDALPIYTKVKDALSNTSIKVFAGEDALEEVAAMDCYDMMLAAIVGFAGLKPTLKAIENKKAIALANKETLVVAGDIVMNMAVENQVPIIPVDSEHSAIFQCLVGETRNK